MKNFAKFFAFVAVAVTAFASCERELNAPVDKKAVTIVVKPEVEALLGEAAPVAPASKTYIDANKNVLWGTGEYMNIAVAAGETTSFATSNADCADSFNGQASAEFEFSVSPESAASYTYMGLYPASATVDNKNADNYKVNLPAIQNATASSYDPAAYIMVAKPKESDNTLSEWTATFRHATALNKITLKNVPSGVSFNKVKITAEGKKLAGGRHFNLTTGEGLEVYGTDATIEVLYATAVSGTNIDVWFTSWDAEIAAGEKLTIIAYTTDSKSYTKEITARTEGIKFQEGYLNTLGVNLSGITPETIATIDGDYVILAEQSGSYYALKGKASGTHIASVDYTGSTESYAGDASLVWTITPSSSGYTIKNGNNYIGWTSGNTADLVDEYSYDATKCLMGIDDNGGGTYKIYVAADVTRILAKNGQYDYFGFYNGSGYNALVLVPATALETVATPTFSPAAGEVASGTEVTISTTTSGATIHYTVDGTDPTSSSATFSSPIEITATTTIKAIAVKSGMADSEIATATYTIQGAGSDWELVSDFSTIADGGEYIFVNVQSSTSYYMNTATCNQGNGTQCVALTILPTESGFVASDNMILVLSGSAEGFVASNKEGKQLKIGATNNGLAMNAESGTILTFYTDDSVSGCTLKGNDTANPAVLRYIGMNTTVNFRCYNSVNNNVKTGEYVWYHHIGTGSNVTWNLESIAITTAPTKTTYTAGEIFDPAGMVVTGHFVDADDATNTKDEAVTGYTIDPNSALATTNTQVTITYQGKTTTQAITVNDAPDDTPILQYTLTPASGTNNSYDKNCDITISGITWNLTGNSTILPWRIGGKSLTNVDRALYSKTALAKNISKIEITHGAASSITVNSMTVIVSKNADFSSPVSTLTPSFVANSTMTVDRQEGKDWSNCYYKIIYKVTVSGTNNKFVEFTDAKFYGTN